MYIDAETLITISAVLAALGGIGGVVVWCIKFVDRQKKQDKELAAIRKEQTHICYGVLACLKGLKEQGCNGPVTAALDKLEKHLNKRPMKRKSRCRHENFDCCRLRPGGGYRPGHCVQRGDHPASVQPGEGTAGGL